MPDLLEQRDDGSIALWDARPPDRRDQKFEESVAVTAAACAEVGWSHQVFTGFEPVLRHALRWLSAYRTSRPWHLASTNELKQLLPEGGLIATVLEADRGGGHLVQTMWHLLWAGTLVADLTEPLTSETALRWCEPSTSIEGQP